MRADCGSNLDLLRAAAVLVSHHAAHACAHTTPHCTVCPLAGQCRFAAAGPARSAAAIS